MARVRVDMRQRGARQLLRSPEVLAELERRGRAIRDAAGGEEAGYEAQPYTGKNRARVSVRTWTPEAMRREAREKRLLRALDAGRK